jgi:SHS2 domain-containing protein
MTPFEEIEHTADWALRVWAPTLSELYVEAARGMFHLTAPQAAGPPATPVAGAFTAPSAAPPAGQPRSITINAGDAESLLVAWLQELLYLSETEGVRFDDFAVERLTPTHLTATAWARPASRPEKPIKAVTYHNLAIRRVDGGYAVALVFDV